MILLCLFVLWERYVESQDHTPLVSLGLFRNRQFTSGTATTAVLTLSLTGLIFALPIYFQAVEGRDAFHTGLALLPLSIALFVSSPASLVLSKKFRPKHIIQFGLITITIAFAVIRAGILPEGSGVMLNFGLILFGVGMGMVQSQINNLTLSAVSVQQGGEASGVSNTFRQIGSSFGSAIIGAVLLASLATNLVAGVRDSTQIPAIAKDKIANTINSQTSNVEFG